MELVEQTQQCGILVSGYLTNNSDNVHILNGSRDSSLDQLNNGAVDKCLVRSAVSCSCLDL